MPALEKYRRAWCDCVGKLSVLLRERELQSYDFIIYNMACAYIREVICKVCGWYFTLLLSAPAALGASNLGFYSTSENGGAEV